MYKVLLIIPWRNQEPVPTKFAHCAMSSIRLLILSRLPQMSPFWGDLLPWSPYRTQKLMDLLSNGRVRTQSSKSLSFYWSALQCSSQEEKGMYHTNTSRVSDSQLRQVEDREHSCIDTCPIWLPLLLIHSHTQGRRQQYSCIWLKTNTHTYQCMSRPNGIYGT